MREAGTTPDERFEKIIAACLGEPEVTPPMGTGFGASALKVRGKIFAMRLSAGALVVKLPRARVDALTAAGKGDRFDPGHGRLMKEWLVIDPAATEDWLPLAREALAFVAGRY